MTRNEKEHLASATQGLERLFDVYIENYGEGSLLEALNGLTGYPAAHVRKLSRAASRILADSPPPPSSTSEAVLLDLLSADRLTMDLRLRIRSAKINLDHPMRVAVFEIDFDNPNFAHIRAALPAGHSVRFRDALALLMDVPDGGSGAPELALACEKYRLRCGVSDVFTGGENVSAQCRNAFTAIAFAAQFNLGGYVYEYGDFRFFDLLSSFDTPRELFRYMHPVLNKLRDIDAQSGSSYFHSLHCYLKHDANLSQSAKALFIHRNTLNYRLKRIEELTGLALGDYKTRFALIYSYHIAEFLGLV